MRRQSDLVFCALEVPMVNRTYFTVRTITKLAKAHHSTASAGMFDESVGRLVERHKMGAGCVVASPAS